MSNLYDEFLDAGRYIPIMRHSPEEIAKARNYVNCLTKEELQTYQFTGRFWAIDLDGSLQILADNNTVLFFTSADDKGATYSIKEIGNCNLPDSLRGRFYLD